MGGGKGREPRLSFSFPSRHSPRAAVFPSPQAYGQETFTVKAGRTRPLRRRETITGHFILVFEKNWEGKSRDYRDAIVYVQLCSHNLVPRAFTLGSQYVFRPQENTHWRFKIPPV